MRKSVSGFVLGAVAVMGMAAPQASAGLIITGVFDAPLPGGLPKGVELYATSDIPDLSIYGIEAATNGAASSGAPEAILPAVSLSAGDFYYLENGDGTAFTQWFGFAPDFPSVPGGAVNHNGDDVLILYENGVVYDQFGESNTDGTGTAWDTLDGWAYRNDNVGPNGGAFSASDWTFSGADAWDGDDGPLDDGTNATSSPPMPIGTYVPEPASLALLTLGGLAVFRRR